MVLLQAVARAAHLHAHGGLAAGGRGGALLGVAGAFSLSGGFSAASSHSGVRGALLSHPQTLQSIRSTLFVSPQRRHVQGSAELALGGGGAEGRMSHPQTLQHSRSILFVSPQRRHVQWFWGEGESEPW